MAVPHRGREEAGLDGLSHFPAPLVEGTIDHSGIGAPVDLARTLLRRDAEQSQQGVPLAGGAYAVAIRQVPQHGVYLRLEVPAGIDYAPQLLEGLLHPFDRRVQAELALDPLGSLDRTLLVAVIIDRPAVRLDARGDDMEVFAVYVPVSEDDVGLIAVAHLLHIAMRDFQQLEIVQTVVRMRVERDVKDGLRESGARMFEPRAEGFSEFVGIDFPICGCNGQVVAEQRLGLSRIHLELVVEQHPDDVLAERYSGNHSFRASSVRSAIRSLRAFRRRVSRIRISSCRGMRCPEKWVLTCLTIWL